MMRNLGLDLLRLAAVVLVLGRHLQIPKDANLFLKLWHTGGWVGVDLFFVLSGFLVSGLIYKEYLREQRVDITRFLIRRAFKIYPAFYAFIAFTVVYKILSDKPIAVAPLIGELLFIQNYLGGLWHHTWSLAVEEHFYIGIAVLFSFLVKRGTKQSDGGNPFRYVPLIFGVVAVACLGLRIATGVILDEFSYYAFLFGTHIRIDSLMFGVLLAYLWYFHDLETRMQKVHTAWLVGLGLLLLSPAFLFPVNQYWLIPIVGVIGLYIGSGSLLLAMVRCKQSSSKVLIVLGSLGAASYSIYLWHMAVESWGWSAMKQLTGIIRFDAYFVFYFAGSLGIGWVLSRAVEWPMLKVRDRLFPRKARTELSASADNPNLSPDN